MTFQLRVSPMPWQMFAAILDLSARLAIHPPGSPRFAAVGTGRWKSRVQGSSVSMSGVAAHARLLPDLRPSR